MPIVHYERSEGEILPTAADLPSEDGVPMDSHWHRAAINLLIASIETHWAGPKDFSTGGNTFLYFDSKNPRGQNFRGPDFFVVKDAPYRPRRLSWVVWEEGYSPDVVVELLSPETAVADRTTKKRIYEQTLKTPDYFCYDPDTELLEGWRLTGGVYEPLSVSEDGRIWSQELDLFFGPWKGEYQRYEHVWLRMFDRQGRLIGFPLEAIQAEKEAAKVRLMRAERDRQAARADREAANAQAMREEIDRLERQLAELRLPAAE